MEHKEKFDAKITLNKNQLIKLVFDNKYQVKQETRLSSRCIDGRYTNGKDLPAFAFPGAHAGILATIMATANVNGYNLDREKAFEAVASLAGGKNKLQFHTDNHAQTKDILAGCGHITQMTLTPNDYNLSTEDVHFIKTKFSQAKKLGADQVILSGSHQEGAVVMIEGQWGINPQYLLDTEDGRKVNIQIFIYHQTLVSEYFRLLAHQLIEAQAVGFRNGETEEMLYTALLETADNHLMETAKRLAKGLPIYHVKFDEKGEFEIEELKDV